MTSIAIVREEMRNDGEPRFSAVTNTGTVQSTGKTVGEAIDALMAKLPATEAGDLAIVVQTRGDEFFSAAQISRLQDLMEKGKSGEFESGEHEELKSLINAELIASGKRAERLANMFGL